MAPLYDLMLMLDAEAPSERRTQILADVEKAIEAKGSIESKHDWGVRTMTYEIDHRTDADYHLLQFKADPTLLEQLDRTLRLTDGIVRFRIVKLAPGTPPPPAVTAAPRPDAAAEAAASAATPAAPATGDAAADPVPATAAVDDAPDTPAPAAEPAPAADDPAPPGGAASGASESPPAGEPFAGEAAAEQPAETA